MFLFFYYAVSNRKPKKSNSSSDQFITLKPDIGPPVVYKLVTRRPLAGPFAFSYIPVPAWNHPRVFLSNDVSDTWLFRNYSVGYALYIPDYYSYNYSFCFLIEYLEYNVH